MSGKAPTAAEYRHHDRLRAIGCLICAADASIHHVISNGFQRITKDHRLVAPLCPAHHQDGPEAVHKIGQDRFNAIFEIDLLTWAIDEWGVSAVLEFDHLRRVA